MKKQKARWCKCLRCGWRWLARKSEPPAVCPHCHSPNWDVSRKNKRRFLPAGCPKSKGRVKVKLCKR